MINAIVPREGRTDVYPKSRGGEMDRCISVIDDCSGDIECVEIQIESRGGGWQEIHLDYEEAKFLRQLIKKAIKTRTKGDR